MTKIHFHHPQLILREKKTIDPRGRPTVTARSDHYIRTCCPYVPAFQNLSKQNNFQVRIVIASGGTVGLAEWIIDGTHVLFYCFPFWVATICISLQVPTVYSHV